MENELSVLVIEDEALIAETIRLMLEDFGFHIAGVCYDYDQALMAIHSGRYDLLLTDLDLGEGLKNRSGLGLVSTMQSIRHVPFIFLTAFDDHDTIRQATSLRPSAYLTKPINPATLYASIQVAMEHFRNSQPTTSIENPTVPDFIYIKVGKRLIKLFWADVYQLESTKNYVLLRTAEHPYGVPIRSSLLSVMQEMMPAHQQERFLRISRSMLIDRSIIRSYSETQVETRHGIFKCTIRSSEWAPGKTDDGKRNSMP